MKACFDCKSYRMCYIRKWLMDNFQFGTNSKDFNSNFRLIFESVAKACKCFEEKEEL